MSIEALLEAAEWLERRERECSKDHVYAQCDDVQPDMFQRSKHRHGKTKSKSQNNRTTHNELEKNRRAHLRNCLEKLKEIVPLGPESNRHTTLGLLTKAKAFIKNLEEKDKKHQTTKDQLLREQKYLRERLDQLQDATTYLAHVHKRRSISECSSGVSSSSSNSEPESSEPNDLFDSPDNAARILHSFANFKMHIEKDVWPMVERESISNSY